MSAGVRYRAIEWRGALEWTTEVGAGPPVLLIPPLLEEMNRCRAILIEVGRALAERGHGLHVPDLPGTGESERRLPTVTWDEWREFVERLVADLAPLAILSVRGGALLEPEGPPAWRLSPVEGLRIGRELVRARKAAGDPATADAIDATARAVPTEFAGYELAPGLYAGLADATLPTRSGRTVRLRGEAAAADRVIEAAPPWRTAEPRRDPGLSRALGADIADWLDACAA